MRALFSSNLSFVCVQFRRRLTFLGSSLGPDADKVVAVQAVIHIDAVAVEMEVMGSGLVYSQLFVQT